MMNLAIKALKTDIQNINWVDRYGGLVTTFNLKDPGPEGEPIEKSYPISVEADEKECFESGRYYDMVPNDEYRSVVYWEQTGDITKSFRRRGQHKYFQFSGPARIVVWLNLNALGYQTSTITEAIKANLVNFLDRRKYKAVQQEKFVFGAIRFNVVSEVNKTSAIFSKYSYFENQALFMFPYDYFAYNCTIDWDVPSNCIEDIPIQSVNCPDAQEV